MTAPSSSRREFLQAAAAAGDAGRRSPAVHAAGSDVLRVGLVGCGGRGTGAASQALAADSNVQLVAMADAFEDRLESSLDNLQKDEKVGAKVDVTPENRFVGFDAYQKLIDSGVDVVLLCTPPHFRPIHLKAAVEAGKHVFAEKPVAVDAPGVRSVLETCELAKTKNLSVVSGLCLRYDNGFREMVRRLHDGAVGDDHHALGQRLPERPLGQAEAAGLDRDGLPDAQLVQLHLALGRLQRRAARPLPRRLRLGHEGAVPRSRPSAWAAGRCSPGPEYGQIYDHFSVVYEYADGARLISNCRQQPGCKNDMSAQRSWARRAVPRSPSGKRGMRIDRRGEVGLRRPRRTPMYQTEHDELFASIRSGQPINNGEYMARSTLLAIMGRMAAYTGQEVTWEMAMNSEGRPQPVRLRLGRRTPAGEDRRAGADAVRLMSDDRPMLRPETVRCRSRHRTATELWTAAPGSGPRPPGSRACAGKPVRRRRPDASTEAEQAPDRSGESRPGSRSPA